MADTCRNLLSILALGFLLILTTVHAGGPELGWIQPRSAPDSSTVGDLLGFDDEFQVDSESHRRILATSNYISYGALNKNRVPCSRRGASYYNCRPGAQANPYTRGCSAITRCSRR